MEIREGSDAGQPIAVTSPNSAPGRAFIDIAINVRKQLAK
jgi:hypothetical protein